ncbi:hypothetical protein N7470_009259 [Penicillium chermesinum]|nr:hypothetical protein N7470_009259 [Penicillium chermesinum]
MVGAGMKETRRESERDEKTSAQEDTENAVVGERRGPSAATGDAVGAVAGDTRGEGDVGIFDDR